MCTGKYIEDELRLIKSTDKTKKQRKGRRGRDRSRKTRPFSNAFTARDTTTHSCSANTYNHPVSIQVKERG